MSLPIVIDTGPLVALLDDKEAKHGTVRERIAGLPVPLLTVESVLSEAAFLLARAPKGPASVMELVRRGAVSVPFRIEAEAKSVELLLRTYENVPMSLADAALVRLLELTPKARLFTFDSDFRIYRLHGRRAVPLLD